MKVNELPNFINQGMEKLEKDVRHFDELLFFSDYDGTLVSFTKDPAKTTTPPEMLKALDRLSQKEGVIVAIISGRPMEDLRRMIPLDDIVLAGLHGMVVDYGTGEDYIWNVDEDLNIVISKLKDEIERIYSDIEGVIVEDKKFGIAFHYRMFQGEMDDLRDDFFELMSKWSDERIKVLEGDKVLEIKPRGWNKGKLVVKLRDIYGKEKPVIYLGDDTTDEDAFRVLKGEDRTFSVKVVNTEKKRCSQIETHAEYRLDGVEEVRTLLELLKCI